MHFFDQLDLEGRCHRSVETKGPLVSLLSTACSVEEKPYAQGRIEDRIPFIYRRLPKNAGQIVEGSGSIRDAAAEEVRGDEKNGECKPNYEIP